MSADVRMASPSFAGVQDTSARAWCGTWIAISQLDRKSPRDSDPVAAVFSTNSLLCFKLAGRTLG
jgi:hypothetical protein